jgi:hypothetical protein
MKGRDMFETKEKVWCCVGDDYETVAYDADSPCRKGGRLFLLRDAKQEDGDFELYSHGNWSGAICVTSKPASVEESMYLWFNFPPKKWGKTPSNKDLKAVREAVEEALSTEKFKVKVKDILQNTDISVVSRENAYYGD